MRLRRSDITFDLHDNKVLSHRNGVEPWRVTLLDTGEKTMTGGRIKRARPYLGDEPFCLTYGDGVSDINVTDLIEFHHRSGALVTVSAVRPPGRFGVLHVRSDDDFVGGFREKSNEDSDYINGGFFVVDPKAIDYIEGDDTVWEREPLENLVREGQGRRLPAPRLLAEHGHAARQDGARGILAKREGTMEELVTAGRRPGNGRGTPCGRSGCW